MSESLFGHLIFQFSSSPENLATEALCYILNRSRTAREAIKTLLFHLNITIPPNVKYGTQDVSDIDSAIPDLVGRDEDGNIVLYGESKFWAGLTANQPVTYLQRLFQQNGKLLVFFAPAKRFVTLWPELLRRCNDANLPGSNIPSDITEIKIHQFPDDRFLVMMSWRVLLNAIHQVLEAEGDRAMLSNVHQLEGLCNQMDASVFLPIQSEELTSNVGQRILQYCDLVDDVTDKLVAEGIASTKGLRATGGRGSYGRYMLIQEKGCSLYYNPFLWNKYGSTPLWFSVASAANPAQWTYDPEARKSLMSLELETPSRLIREDKYLRVPVYLKTGVEKDEILKSVVHQIHEIYRLLYPANQPQLKPSSEKKSAKEIILEVGADGGSLSIVRYRDSDRKQQFVFTRNESALADFLDFADPASLFEEENPVATFEEALALMDKYPWQQLYPLVLQPEYAKQVLEIIQKSGEPINIDRWWNVISHPAR